MGLACQAAYLWNMRPTPSITPSRHPHMMALFLVCLQPPLMAREPPVKRPAMIAFQGSSLLRTALTAQSKVEKRPPQTPKLPPTTGARALRALTAPRWRSPMGEFLNPLIPCHTQPPMTPMAKAPPKSLRITTGQGSLE